MAKKRNAARKSKKPKFIFRIEPKRRGGFRGALPFDQHRTPSETVVMILRLCLRSPLGGTITTTNAVRTFLLTQHISMEQLTVMCQEWLLDLEIGTHVFRLLQAAGYEGNIDDLWYSVANIVKPTRASAGLKKIATHRVIGGKKPWIHFTNSGQTRKPGSHNS